MQTAELTRTSAVRFARKDDTGAIIRLGWQNAGETEYRGHLVFDWPVLQLFVHQVLDDENARVLVFEQDCEVQGVFAFSVCPNFYQFGGNLVASLIIWSVAPKYRGRAAIKLLNAAESEARDMGATRFILTGPGEQFKKLCKHCGFDELETSFIKKLNPEKKPLPQFEVLQGAQILEINELSQMIGNGPMVPYASIASVARDDEGKVIGFVAVRTVLHAAGSYVSPGYRGKGLSRILRKKLEDELAAGGVSRYFATPNTPEDAALFAKYGAVTTKTCQVKELPCR